VSSTNFNYQVALKEGLKSLQQGRLRQAEQSFRYLVDKFPSAEGGYRGLAKVSFEQEDRAGALRILRDGAAALTKSGERAAAIGLLKEAVSLDPRDLATHRRLAAALALAGDLPAAVQEYARFIRDLRDAGEIDRAKLEATYAQGQLKDAPNIASLADLAVGGALAPEMQNGDTPSAAADAVVSADPWSSAGPPPSDAQLWSRGSSQPAPTPMTAPANDPWANVAPSPKRESTWQTGPAATPRGSASFDDPWAMSPSSPAPSPTQPPAAEDQETLRIGVLPPLPPVPPLRDPSPITEAPAAEAAPAEAVAPERFAEEDVEAAAARYLATHDSRAAGAALEAARRYIRDGRTDAASDLLLQLIASGVADHDAQRLLIDVARALGKRDVARAKCQLLVQALLLDGRNDLAAEVELLARTE
jgi:Tfp pilus assembly protein PilF